MKTREEAWNLLNEFTSNPSLIKHAVAVEAAMRHFAALNDEDKEKWGVVGLIHDFDYEKHPTIEEHARAGAEILKEQGWPGEIIHAVLSHSNHTGVSRENLMEKTLFAVDELCGFITAVTLVRPSRDVRDVKPKSVIKKLKDKAFAKSVSRDDIRIGLEELGMERASFIQEILNAMATVAHELELAGEQETTT